MWDERGLMPAVFARSSLSRRALSDRPKEEAVRCLTRNRTSREIKTKRIKTRIFAVFGSKAPRNGGEMLYIPATPLVNQSSFA